MHLNSISIRRERFPVKDRYPFNLPPFLSTDRIDFGTPVTFFAGENGTGKSTLLRAISRKASIYIWEETQRMRFKFNPYAEDFFTCIDAEWGEQEVNGSFFASELFRHFAEMLDEWAISDPALLNYFGGASLLNKSHGQCNMTFFENRFSIKGLYLLDEPESALSPKSQIELLEIIARASKTGLAQFIVATHSPILLSLEGAVIHNFNASPIVPTEYRETDYYRVYKDFLSRK
jgi:predicted ATPase